MGPAVAGAAAFQVGQQGGLVQGFEAGAAHHHGGADLAAADCGAIFNTRRKVFSASWARPARHSSGPLSSSWDAWR